MPALGFLPGAYVVNGRPRTIPVVVSLPLPQYTTSMAAPPTTTIARTWVSFRFNNHTTFSMATLPCRWMTQLKNLSPILCSRQGHSFRSHRMKSVIKSCAFFIFFRSGIIQSATALRHDHESIKSRLSAPEEYLTWQIQFSVVLVSHGLLRLVDWSLPLTTATIISSTGWHSSQPRVSRRGEAWSECVVVDFWYTLHLFWGTVWY